MIIGTLGAMIQKLDLKRLLAYSAIGNAGYMLLGIVQETLKEFKVFFFMLLFISL